MNELIGIGEKVNNAIEAVWKAGLNVKEIEKLEGYITHQETILPLTDPTLVQKGAFKLLDQARERMKLLKPIIQLKEKEKKERSNL